MHSDTFTVPSLCRSKVAPGAQQSEGGAGGGRIVGEGTPDDIAAIEDSHTGRFLRQG